MRIGQLEFQEFAAKKPLTIGTKGEFLSASDALAKKSLTIGSLQALAKDSQIKLTLERYKQEPDFKLGIFGIGVLTKAEVMDHVKSQSDFGKQAVNAEMAYCTELLSSLSAKAIPAWPKIEARAIPIQPDWKPIVKCIWLKLPTRAVFCENTTDSVTKWFADYRIKHVHPVFAARGFTVVALTGTNDVRTSFVPQANNSLTVYLSGIGHGNYTLYTGHLGNHILEVGGYAPAEVAGKAIHYLSCETGKTLGPDTVAHGAKSYAGYTENFVFVWDVPGTPVNEQELFARADSCFDECMAMGHTSLQATNATIAAFNAAIAQVPGTAAATWLTWDRNHLLNSGSGASSILPYRWVKICFPLKALEQLDALSRAGEVSDKIPA